MKIVMKILTNTYNSHYFFIMDYTKEYVMWYILTKKKKRFF